MNFVSYIAEFRNVFDRFDEDGSNAISTSELGPVMKSLGLNLSPEELKRLMKEHDQDGMFKSCYMCWSRSRS